MAVSVLASHKGMCDFGSQVTQANCYFRDLLSTGLSAAQQASWDIVLCTRSA
jgi:hypothetical protein